MKSVNELSNNELDELRTASIKHAANVILSNASSRADDGGDYLHGAIDLLNDVTAYDEESERGDDQFPELRRFFNTIFTAPIDSDYHAHNRYASDAIPTEWDAFIQEQD